MDELHAYLSSTRDCYPAGIPLSTESSSVQSTSPAIPSGKILIVTGPELPEELMEFLKSIITAGMKRQLEDCEICGDDLDLESKIAEESPQAILIFGSLVDLPDGVGAEAISFHNSTPILITRSLSELRLSKERKKEFWGHLQQLLANLRPH